MPPDNGTPPISTTDAKAVHDVLKSAFDEAQNLGTRKNNLIEHAQVITTTGGSMQSPATKEFAQKVEHHGEDLQRIVMDTQQLVTDAIKANGTLLAHAGYDGHDMGVQL